MAFVTDLTAEDNATTAAATANLMATRLGTTLRERFESFIHKRECSIGQTDYNVKMASRAIAAFVVHHLGQVDDNVSGSSVCVLIGTAMDPFHWRRNGPTPFVP